MTGWAQIKLGYAGTVEETAVKLEYDLYYIEHRNILMDLSIIIRTIGTVLGFKRTVAPGHKHNEIFQQNNSQPLYPGH